MFVKMRVYNMHHWECMKCGKTMATMNKPNVSGCRAGGYHMWMQMD